MSRARAGSRPENVVVSLPRGTPLARIDGTLAGDPLVRLTRRRPTIRLYIEPGWHTFVFWSVADREDRLTLNVEVPDAGVCLVEVGLNPLSPTAMFSTSDVGPTLIATSRNYPSPDLVMNALAVDHAAKRDYTQWYSAALMLLLITVAVFLRTWVTAAVATAALVVGLVSRFAFAARSPRKFDEIPQGFVATEPVEPR